MLFLHAAIPSVPKKNTHRLRPSLSSSDGDDDDARTGHCLYRPDNHDADRLLAEAGGEDAGGDLGVEVAIAITVRARVLGVEAQIDKVTGLAVGHGSGSDASYVLVVGVDVLHISLNRPGDS